MTRYTDTKRMFRDIPSNDLDNILVYLKLELQRIENKRNLIQEQLEAAKVILKERR